MLFSKKPATIPDAASALPGRRAPVRTADTHFVFHRPLQGDIPPDSKSRSSALAVSGVQNASSGNRMASG